MLIYEDDTKIALTTYGSANPKLGDMVQVWYLLRSLDPNTAYQQARNLPISAQSEVCGGCPHLMNGTCYITWYQAPYQTWKKYTRGNHEVAHPKDANPNNKPVRLGAAGNPTSIPFWINKTLVSTARSWTGYTHEWLTCDERYKTILMASVDSLDEAKAAQALGWRTFRVAPIGQINLQPNEILCPASRPNSKTDCGKCGLCSGTDGRGALGRKPNVVVEAHGKTRTKIH